MNTSKFYFIIVSTVDQAEVPQFKESLANDVFLRAGNLELQCYMGRIYFIL